MVNSLIILITPKFTIFGLTKLAIMKKRNIRRAIFIVIAILFLYDNFSPIYFSNMTVTDYGSNSDIIDGRLSRLNDAKYVFTDEGHTLHTEGMGNQKVMLRQVAASYGIGSYIPIYKSVTPSITFDCYLQNPKRYIGKIEIAKKITATGITRVGLKRYIQKEFIAECVQVLTNKSIPYDKLNGMNTSKTGEYSPRILAIASGDRTSLKIPIRQRDAIYTDTVYLTNSRTDSLPNYDVISVDKLKKRLIVKSIAKNGSTLYSENFSIEKMPTEDEGSYQSFFALWLP